MNRKHFFTSYQDSLPKKKLELFVFIDPFCKDCIQLHYILYKLDYEYGQYYTLRQILSYEVERLNTCKSAIQKKEPYNNCIELKKYKDKAVEHHLNPFVLNPYYVTLALKSAQFQGTKAGARYLRNLIQSYYIHHDNNNEMDILDKCAKEAEIDISEFYNDLQSDAIISAMNSDMTLKNEMGITSVPSIVIYSNENEKEAIKIAGIQTYRTYEQILINLLGISCENKKTPSIQKIIDDFIFFTAEQLSFLTERPLSEIEIELKKLQLLQVVERLKLPTGTYYRKKYVSDIAYNN